MMMYDLYIIQYFQYVCEADTSDGRGFVGILFTALAVRKLHFQAIECFFVVKPEYSVKFSTIPD